MIDLSLCRLQRCLGSLLIGLCVLAGLTLQPAWAQQPSSAEAARDDYVLGPGDAIRIQVFQNPDLTVEARVSEAGVISYPLLGAVRIGGMSPTNVEKLISQRLRDGKFLQNPQVTVNITTFRSQQVSVLGNVTRPGRYPIETTGMRLSEVLSLAGGVAATGADDVVLVTSRSGKPIRLEIDLVDMFASGDLSQDPQMQAGDVVYVNRAPQYYIYGQVQRPGQYGVDRGLGGNAAEFGVLYRLLNEAADFGAIHLVNGVHQADHAIG
jgi:polysaccharide export outer membrane protein